MERDGDRGVSNGTLSHCKRPPGVGESKGEGCLGGPAITEGSGKSYKLDGM